MSVTNLNDNCMEFICQYKQLKKLSIKYVTVSYDQWIRIFNALPDLGEISANWSNNDSSDIFDAVSMYGNLKKITLMCLGNRGKLDTLQRIIDDSEWRLIDGNNWENTLLTFVRR